MLRLVVETAHKYGKFAGTVSVPSLKECFELGYDFVNCGADVTAVSQSCKSIIKNFEEIQA